MAKPSPTSGTFEELLEDATPQSIPIARRLRSIIWEIHPETVEIIYLGYNSASYGIGPKKMSEHYCYIMPQKAQVNLGFYYGVDLDDQEGLLEGTGKKLRHVKVRSVEDADRAAVRQLIQESLQERKTKLSP